MPVLEEHHKRILHYQPPKGQKKVRFQHARVLYNSSMCLYKLQTHIVNGQT